MLKNILIYNDEKDVRKTDVLFSVEMQKLCFQGAFLRKSTKYSEKC